MSGRVEKSTPRSKSKKTEQRHNLVALLDEFGFEVMPCSLCAEKGWRCTMMEGVSRCKECVRRGRSCDGSGLSVSAVSRVVDESRRLRSEEQEASDSLRRASEALEKAHREAQEAFARLERIRKQRESLVTRGVEMARRGLRSLDELEAAERVESEAAVDAQSLGAFGVVDWNATDFDFVLPQIPPIPPRRSPSVS
ncbi:hypothetical protein PG993_003996 [Apiospora rasikravindrae]|uniref:Uncharacterized protein n=1 Tax=Apiospora rasikravindrae TaxID=990691 RepID=A0ABR1TC33_9PEZI